VKLKSTFRADDKVTSIPIKPGTPIKNVNRKHNFINFFRFNYFWGVFTRAPWYMWICSLLLLLVDLVLQKDYFKQMIMRHVVNKTGLIGQYYDMLTYSQPSICSGKLWHHGNNEVEIEITKTENIVIYSAIHSKLRMILLGFRVWDINPTFIHHFYAVDHKTSHFIFA